MFLFPYGTNAPIYYWPITTVGLPQVAMKIHQRMAKELSDWMLAESDLLHLIRSLQEK